LAVELIDVPERIEAFFPTLTELAPGSLATREPARISRITPTR
jgi:PII-like signaling protein